MNSVERTTKSCSKSSPRMWLEILGIVLGVTTVFGLAVLRAELRDRADGQQATLSASLELTTQAIASQV